MPWLSAERSFATTPEDASALNWISLAVLILVYLGSLFRVGPRRIFSESLQLSADDGHDHGH